MKLKLVTVESSLPQWFQLISSEYETKINRFVRFAMRRLKAKAMGRSNADEKRRAESKLILQEIEGSDFVILFDEGGKSLSTEKFSKSLIEILEGGKGGCLFIIGGAFGASDELKKRANMTWKLSDLTLNHLVAQLVAQEQIYRALTIWKGVPYHNE